MRTTETGTAATAPAPSAAYEELVVEDLSQLAAEEFQPGTCICWVQESLTD